MTLFLIRKTWGYKLLIFIILASFSCVRHDEFPTDYFYFSGAEKVSKKGDKFQAENDSTFLFSGGKSRSNLEAFAGDYSVCTTPKKAFSFSCKINHAGPDWYFKLSVWRKSKDGKGALVSAGKKGRNHYLATSKPVESRNDGWEKLVLEFYTPPTFNRSEISFYVWNNSADTVYFDNFKIERLSKKKYPKYKEDPLSIVLDSSDILKIGEKRKDAFKSGILQTSDEDWVKAIVFQNGDMMKANIRLKGDWLDHLKGDKWSFRVKMRKNYSWNHLRTFSVQTPAARDFLREWEAHKYNASKDVLTTRYGFVPLIFNNNPLGMYAWEEHFEKHLLEYNQRREGPILKFSEDAFWQLQKISIQNDKKWFLLPYFEASVIKPFKESKTVGDSLLYRQFLNAQILMHQFKKSIKPPDQIFDIKKLAAFYAIHDLTYSRHGTAWHNQRFYFNPVLCKLEPIAFDGYTDHLEFIGGIETFFAYHVLNNQYHGIEEHLVRNLFVDSTFVHYYLGYLNEFSNPDYIAQMSRDLKPQLMHYDSLLRLEFSYYHYDNKFIDRNAKSIQEYLPELKQFLKLWQVENKISGLQMKQPEYNDPSSVMGNTPEYFVNAYFENVNEDSAVISVHNYFPRKLIILGTGSKNGLVEHFLHPEPYLEPFKGSKEVYAEISSQANAVFLFFMIDGLFDTYSVRINTWPYPKGETPQQELMATVNLDNSLVFDRIEGSNIYIKQGNIQINKPLIIPKGYTVYFNEETKLDLIDSAMFISYSPVLMQGLKNKPIRITSSDFSANGFTVLQASGLSKLEHVVFENLSTLNYKGWTLTGAVTFYESDVEIENTLFYRNQCEDALNIIRSDFLVENSTFDNIYGDAFDSDFCTGWLNKSLFTNIENDAIDFSGSEIEISNTRIMNTNDKGISGGENSHLKVRNVTIQKTYVGIASKDISVVEVSDTEIIDCDYGIVLFQKKPEYGPASMIIDNTKIIKSKQKFLIEKGSEIKLDEKLIKGDVENVANLFY